MLFSFEKPSKNSQFSLVPSPFYNHMTRLEPSICNLLERNESERRRRLLFKNSIMAKLLVLCIGLIGKFHVKCLFIDRKSKMALKCPYSAS